MNQPPTVATGNDRGQGSLRTYTLGFIASLALTIAAYLLVVHQLLSRRLLIGSIITLAFAQFTTQMVLFLHLGREARPRWKLGVFFMMTIVVGILVFGSLWIMHNLNYHMSLQQMYQYMNNQGDGI